MHGVARREERGELHERGRGVRDVQAAVERGAHGGEGGEDEERGEGRRRDSARARERRGLAPT